MRGPAELHHHLNSGTSLGLGHKLLLALLTPLGWIYGLIGKIRVFLYRWGLLKSYRADAVVVSVGNLAAGGTGKTPMVDYLVRRLSERGRKIAVVSRGYRGKVDGVGHVNPADGPWLKPEVCGDEPYLLACRNPDVPVLVAPQRAEGIRKAVKDFAADTVVLDDAFQHLAVHRDLDIVLLDARRPLGNGKVLPAGILREFPSALERADLLVLTRSSELTESPPFSDVPVLHCRHRLGDAVRSLSGEIVPISKLFHQRGVAFAGIASPERFFSSLVELGLDLCATVSLPDHVFYEQTVLARLLDQAKVADFLVTTEKDGVKLSEGEFPIPCYQVPMTLDFANFDTLDDMLESLYS